MVKKLNLEQPVQVQIEKPYVERPIVVEEGKMKVGLWEKTFKKDKVKKPSFVCALYKRKNGTVEPLYIETNKGMFTVNGKTYHEHHHCRWLMKIGKDKLPYLEIEEDGLIPNGNQDYYQRLTDVKEVDRIIAEHQDLAIKAIRHAELVRLAGEDKKPMNNKLIIGLVILGIIGLAFLKNYI